MTPKGLDDARTLKLLEAVEKEPEARQVDLAVKLSLAVGTVNWLLKRFASKGYVKIKRISKWRWRYVLTPEGMSEKIRLTQSYVKISMELYRETRNYARELLNLATSHGYSQIRLKGDPDSEILDICSLTCLEQGVEVVPSDKAPQMCVDGSQLRLEWPDPQ